MEDDVLQLFGVDVERRLEVGLVEEARIAEARGQNFLIARDDRRAAIIGDDVRRADERIGELAGRIAADEVFLVHAGGQLDDLFRHAQIIGVEPAEHRHRPFGQAAILIDQTFIGHEHEARVRRRLFRASADDRAALFLIDDDMASLQLCGIVARIADGDRAGMMEAVAHRRGTAADPVNLAWDNIIAKDRDDALKRTHPAQAFGRARSGAPAL